MALAKQEAAESRADVQDTEAFLKEVEKKWEVVDVDDDESVIGQSDAKRSKKNEVAKR